MHDDEIGIDDGLVRRLVDRDAPTLRDRPVRRLDASGSTNALFRGLAVGDPSVDLVVAWEVLGPDAREVFRTTLGLDDDTWLRGRAWALAIAAMTFPYYWQTMPARCAARLAMAQQVLTDHRS